LDDSKKCIAGAFNISRTIHLLDIVAFSLFLQRIDATAARAFMVFPTQVGFNATIYQGTTASVDYVEALSIVDRARHPLMAVTRPTTSTTSAIIYTAFHCFFTTQKCLSIQIAARSSADSVIIAAKNAKSAARIMPPAAAGIAGLLDRKRKHDESVCTSRRCDNEIRFAEAHRLNMTLSIERIRSVLKTRD
jgi:ABC-type nickel/cobalt efflux system permease component RcnA